MSKTKNSAPVSPNTYRLRRLMAVAVLAGVAAIGGEVILGGGGKTDVGSEPAKAQLTQKGIARLNSYKGKHPNILDVSADPAHPGLERVTYTFSPGHNNISFLAAEVAPDQTRDHAYSDIESYNNGSDLVHYGDELTVDVDPSTGFVVPNPDLPSSAENNS